MYKQFSFEEFEFSSAIIRDLVGQKDKVRPFVSNFYSEKGLNTQVSHKSFSQEKRDVLVEALTDQNRNIELSTLTKQNITALKDQNTFTITTGHQLNLMTGPLYSIYKVAQVVSIARRMNASGDGNKYVPVFWMATEDHDFEEINHLHLFGNKVTYNKEDQVDAVVGAIKTAGMSSFLDEIEDKYREEEMKTVIRKFTNAYRESDNLAGATRAIMNTLFAEFGLVIVDGDDIALKQMFKLVAEKEIKTAFVKEAVDKTNGDLEVAGYHSQVFVRDCNLFYIAADKKRVRIAKEDQGFKIGDEKRGQEELLKELNEHPERFSPNALLRPVYQELILPNLAYIGGGGEIAYWLQLAGVFSAIDLPMPLLRVRDSFVLLNSKALQDLEALQLPIPRLKADIHDIVKEIALQDVAVDIQLTQEQEALTSIKEGLTEKANKVNKGLGAMVEAEFSKMVKAIEKIESKLIKAEKSKHEQKANKIKKLQDKIFPNGGFQERYDNFLPYFLSDSNFVSKIVDNLNEADLPAINVLEL